MFQIISNKIRTAIRRLRSHLPAERKALKRGIDDISNEIKSLRYIFFKNSPSKIFTFAFKWGGATA